MRNVAPKIAFDCKVHAKCHFHELIKTEYVFENGVQIAKITNNIIDACDKYTFYSM